jgi:hypothetical protein
MNRWRERSSALLRVHMGAFTAAVAALRADLRGTPDQRRHARRPGFARIQSGGRRVARPRFASADRVDRGPQVTRPPGRNIAPHSPVESHASDFRQLRHRRLGPTSEPARARRWPIAVLLLVACGCGTAIAAAYEALSEMDEAANSYALAVVILLGAIALAAGFGTWKLIEDAHDLMGE